MHKIFLSHSSKDKSYVSDIAGYFGSDRCVYDSMCFEAGMKNLDEIFREMDKTCIFVVFLSDASLSSEWVQTELSIAEERLHYDNRKLSQIFPIIIDPTINHKDTRIPAFLRQGIGSYNLRVITSSAVACRKIKAQQMKYLIDHKLFISEEQTCFYGRDIEISKFKKSFDAGQEIRCVVASGLGGIGRKSFLLQCLRQSHIIEEYYTPPVISLDSMASIEDMLVKLSEVGFGSYSLETATLMSDMDSKIFALEELLKEIRDYQEQVIIYDNGCLIDKRGNVVHWFVQALKNIRPEVTLIIAATNRLSHVALEESPSIFSENLSVLSYPEWSGLMRVYGKMMSLDISLTDRAYFRDILTGYPPQVRYCVEQMKETSIEEVKQNSHIIVDHFSPRITAMLEAAIPSEMQEDAYGLLAFASAYGIVPTDLLLEVLKIKDSYKEIFTLFRTLTICRYLGVANEYVEVNPVVSDYIQRSRYELPDDIKNILESRIEAFNESITIADETKTEDFENIKYYLKSNILAGKEIPTRFMYSTLYLSSVYDLYNRQEYPKVISIVEKLKEVGAFSRYDKPVQARIQGYFCRSLARVGDNRFYVEVEFFKQYDDMRDINEYNFLRGFMFRHNSQYDKALERYKRVLANQPRHRSTMREIVIVYRGLEDYETAYEYAKANYLREPENPYQIQPFFEILIRRTTRDLTSEDLNFIEEIMCTIARIHSTKPTVAYYEITGQYAAYIERNPSRAFALLKEGMRKFPESSFIARSLFDCAELFKALPEMKIALAQMEKFSENSKSIKSAYHIRTALYYAYENKPSDFIEHCIDSINGLNDEAKRRIKRKAFLILNRCY